jgi:hypothetical protein
MTKADFLKEQARLEERRGMLDPSMIANLCSEGRGCEDEGGYEKDSIIVVWISLKNSNSVLSRIPRIGLRPFFNFEVVVLLM